MVWYRSVRYENHLVVDTRLGDRSLTLFLDLTFHALPCNLVELRVEDSKGVAYGDARMHLRKVSPPGSDSTCRLTGSVSLDCVAGTVHVTSTRMMGFFGGVDTSFNASHTIHGFAFGAPFPGQVNPLNDFTPPAAGQWQYHVKVVPTTYEPLYGRSVDSAQYSATDFSLNSEPGSGLLVMPGVFWRYDFSPILVRVVATRHSFAQFLVSLCGLVGGLYALSGLVDGGINRTLEMRKEK